LLRHAGWGLLAPAVVLALGGGVLALTVAVLDPAGIREHAAGRQVAVLGNAEAVAVALGIAVLAAALGTIVGTPLGVALRSRRRTPWSFALGVLALLPLATPPLAIALGIERLLEAGGWLEALPAASTIDDTARTAIALGLAHLPSALALVALVVSAAGASAETATLETARLLGAGRVRRFLTFQLPAATPAALLGLALAFLLVSTSVAAALSLASGVAS
jgi:ABC-type spermidine/putrescine transport system permease subunit II